MLICQAGAPKCQTLPSLWLPLPLLPLEVGFSQELSQLIGHDVGWSVKLWWLRGRSKCPAVGGRRYGSWVTWSCRSNTLWVSIIPTNLPTPQQYQPNLALRDLKSDEILNFLEKHKFSYNFSLRDIRQLRQAAKDAAKLEEPAVQQRGAKFDESCRVLLMLDLNMIEYEPMDEYVFFESEHESSISKDFLDVIFGSWKVQKRRTTTETRSQVADQLWQNPALKNPSAFNCEVPNDRSTAPGLHVFSHGILGLCATINGLVLCTYVYYAQISMASQSCFRYQRCF